MRYREEAIRMLENKTISVKKPLPVEGDFPCCYSCPWKAVCAELKEEEEVKVDIINQLATEVMTEKNRKSTQTLRCL
jgi:hypothetical protein